MPNRLKDLNVVEVSFVDAPAVPKAKVFATKRADRDRVSILKMGGGGVADGKAGLLGLIEKVKERARKMVSNISETMANSNSDFWHKLYQVTSTFEDLVYEIVYDSDISDKAAALNSLIDELAVELKKAVGLLPGQTTKGADMDNKEVLGAIKDIGDKVDGFGKRIDALEAGGKGTKEPADKGKPEPTDKAEPAGGGTDDEVKAALEGLGKKVDSIDKRLADIEGQPLPSAQVPGQDTDVDKGKDKWPSLTAKMKGGM